MKSATVAAKPKPQGKPKPDLKSDSKKQSSPPASLKVVPDPERAPVESVEEPNRRWKSDNSKLPLVSQIPDQEVMEQAIATLQRASDAKQQREAWERIEDAAKEELAAIALANDLSADKSYGFRWGKLGISARYQSSSRLSVEKLVENGVDPDVIEKSREKGEPHLVVSVVDFL